jgi:hypothetical protein
MSPHLDSLQVAPVRGLIKSILTGQNYGRMAAMSYAVIIAGCE